MGHSINLVAEDIARQVKRHRDKRRRRRGSGKERPTARRVVVSRQEQETGARAGGARRTGPASGMAAAIRVVSGPEALATVAPMSLIDRALRVGEQVQDFEKHVAQINDFEPELELDSDELRTGRTARAAPGRAARRAAVQRASP